MLRMRNWIRGRSRIDEKGQLVTSNFDITRVIENAKDLITKEKTNEFKTVPEKPIQRSPRDRRTSRSHMSYLFNYIMEARVRGGHPYVQEA
jgi:hypothetical protein